MSFLRLSLVAASTLLSSISFAGALECRAIYRTLDENRRSIEQIQMMPVTQRIGTITQYALDHQGRHFHVSDDGGQTYLVQIVQPPDYTRGLVIRASPDAQGRLNASEVIGHTVYKIECVVRP